MNQVKKVNTKEIIKKVSQEMNCYYSEAQKIITEHLYQVILNELKNGNEVKIHPFGKFYLREAPKETKYGKKRKIIKFQPSDTFQREIDQYFLKD